MALFAKKRKPCQIDFKNVYYTQNTYSTNVGCVFLRVSEIVESI